MVFYASFFTWLFAKYFCRFRFKFVLLLSHIKSMMLSFSRPRTSSVPTKRFYSLLILNQNFLLYHRIILNRQGNGLCSPIFLKRYLVELVYIALFNVKVRANDLHFNKMYLVCYDRAKIHKISIQPLFLLCWAGETFSLRRLACRNTFGDHTFFKD